MFFMHSLYSLIRQNQIKLRNTWNSGSMETVSLVLTVDTVEAESKPLINLDIFWNLHMLIFINLILKIAVNITIE